MVNPPATELSSRKRGRGRYGWVLPQIGFLHPPKGRRLIPDGATDARGVPEAALNTPRAWEESRVRVFPAFLGPESELISRKSPACQRADPLFARALGAHT